VHTGVVRTAMPEDRHHGVHPGRVEPGTGHAGDAAHGLGPSLVRGRAGSADAAHHPTPSLPEEPGAGAPTGWAPCRSRIMASITLRSISSSTLTERSGGMTYGRITSPQIDPRSIRTSRRVR